MIGSYLFICNAGCQSWQAEVSLRKKSANYAPKLVIACAKECEKHATHGALQKFRKGSPMKMCC
jgi:hypothetical protein